MVTVADTDDDGDDQNDRVADLVRAVAARDAFIAVAAHELRNPMTPMSGQIELLVSAIRSGKCSLDQVEQRLERIQQTVRRYIRRADVLLNVSRLTSGKIEFSLEEFDVAVLLRDLAAEFDGPAQRNGVAIEVEAPATLPIAGDRVAVEQILDNLISNALKYGGRTPVTLSAAVNVDRLHGDRLCLQVRDHGPGIPAAERVRVFERFERVIGRSEPVAGFGVGLWVVGQLVAAMDGTITVDDAPDGGARFVVVLPVDMRRRNE